MTKQVESLVRTISKYTRKLKEVQDKCPHKNFDAYTDASTGSFDPMDDKYWVVVKCLDCDKHMRFDSMKHPLEYSKYTSKL